MELQRDKENQFATGTVILASGESYTLVAMPDFIIWFYHSDYKNAKIQTTAMETLPKFI